MHVYFSGIGGSVINSLAMIAHQAGYEISGSDIAPSPYIDNLKKYGVSDIHIGQTAEQITAVHAKKPIDWFVYSAALPMTDPDHPELKFCEQNGIRTSKRDEFLNFIIEDKNLKLISIAGTHGKSTTTAMAIWLFKQLSEPISYSVGAKIGFGKTGELDPKSGYFIYETDEFDRNFLSFYPQTSLISGIDYDHPDIYPTLQSYNEAFIEFFRQSEKVFLWHDDAEKLALQAEPKYTVLDNKSPDVDSIKLAGLVNRQNAYLVAKGLEPILGQPWETLIEALDKFPGLSRRFEKITEHVYSDYAHTPPKIRGALQLAHEIAGDNVVVVYEGLHNLRQHFIKDELKNLFDGVKKLYVVPSYLARENPDQPVLSPDDLVNLLSNSSKRHSEAARLDDSLAAAIKRHAGEGDLVLCLSGGGAGSLDEWLRKNF